MAWIRDRALTLALLLMFGVTLAGQLIAGFHEYNEQQDQDGQPRVGPAEYFRTGHPWEATFENWESEFLQMAVFVLLTTRLVQVGSPESRRPGVTELVDVDPRRFAVAPGVPWPVRRGGWVLRLYENSLGLAFVVLFLIIRVLRKSSSRVSDPRHIRMALGAQPGSVVRMVLADVALITPICLVAGAVAAIGAGRLVNSLLFDLSASDRTMIGVTATVLAAAAAFAGYLPARRASRLDPLSALRED